MSITIQHMGQFTSISMRARVTDPTALVINTCSGNDSDDRGTPTQWTWCNPTNRAITQPYHDVTAVSLESLWQSCKLMAGQDRPDPEILAGQWRKNKGRRPLGAYAGPGNPLITSPGAARRAIYIPAYRRLVEHWLATDETVAAWVDDARHHAGPVLLRDFDVGRGVDRNGPLSHAWLLAEYLNNNQWPE